MMNDNNLRNVNCLCGISRTTNSGLMSANVGEILSLEVHYCTLSLVVPPIELGVQKHDTWIINKTGCNLNHCTCKKVVLQVQKKTPQKRAIRLT